MLFQKDGLIFKEIYYYVYPLAIKNYCEDRNLVRKQKVANSYKTKNFTGQTESIYETTYSFPLELMTNIKELY